MSVRKRKWTTAKGEPREAWIVDYVDQQGDRHIETFPRKKDADARHAEVYVNVGAGTHVAPSKSVTVKEAGESWIRAAEADGLERATVDQYRQHLNLHIAPFIGRLKLSDLNPQAVRNFEGRLQAEGRSPAMVRKVITSLGSLVADARELGLTGHNAVRDLRRNRGRGKDKSKKRQKRKLKVGVDIPTPEDISAILRHASKWRALLIVGAFTGLRASELRGLRWEDLEAREIHVRQRADRYYEIGPPKSETSERVVPFGKFVANTLKEWKLACPKSELGLVFPTGKGNVADLANIIRDGLKPAQIAAGVTVPVLDEKGKPKLDKDGKSVVGAKYTGMHALRHFYASWCINRTKDGGLGLPPKNVQERLGHSSITITLDIYGHLFKGDDAEELDAAEERLKA